MKSFDYKEFEKRLTASTRGAYEHIAAATADEQLYAFCLYTSGEATYFTATANTEEGLRAKSEVTGFTTAELRVSPCDWSHHMSGADLFKPVEELLQSAWKEDFSDYHVSAARTFRIARRVLKRLVRENRLGGLYVNLLKGDQSDEEREAWAAEIRSGA